MNQECKKKVSQMKEILINKNEELFLQQNLISTNEQRVKLSENRKISLSFIQFIESILTQEELSQNNNFQYLLEFTLGYKLINDPNVNFDPHIHEAMNESKSNKIQQIIKFGYTYQDSVIRAAKILLETDEKK